MQGQHYTPAVMLLSTDTVSTYVVHDGMTSYLCTYCQQLGN